MNSNTVFPHDRPPQSHPSFDRNHLSSGGNAILISGMQCCFAFTFVISNVYPAGSSWLSGIHVSPFEAEVCQSNDSASIEALRQSSNSYSSGLMWSTKDPSSCFLWRVSSVARFHAHRNTNISDKHSRSHFIFIYVSSFVSLKPPPDLFCR